MSFIDHAPKATVNVGDVQVNLPEMAQAPAPVIQFPEPEALGGHLDAITKAISKLKLEVHVEVPKVVMPEIPAPVINLPESTPHVVNISLLNNKALAILVGVAILQLAMLGALIWR